MLQRASTAALLILLAWLHAATAHDLPCMAATMMWHGRSLGSDQWTVVDENGRKLSVAGEFRGFDVYTIGFYRRFKLRNAHGETSDLMPMNWFSHVLVKGIVHDSTPRRTHFMVALGDC